MGGGITPQRFSERRQVRLNDIPDDLEVDSEVLVHKDVAEATDLWPGDLRVRTGDFFWKVVHGFTDDLQVALNCIFRHLPVRAVIERLHVALTTFDGLENVLDAPRGVSTHNATASASAEVETGRLSS